MLKRVSPLKEIKKVRDEMDAGGRRVKCGKGGQKDAESEINNEYRAPRKGGHKHRERDSYIDRCKERDRTRKTDRQIYRQ